MPEIIAEPGSFDDGFDGTVDKFRLVYTDNDGTNAVIRFQAHHVSPQELLNNQSIRTFFEAIGWDNANSAANMILLPTTNPSAGPAGAPAHTQDLDEIARRLGLPVHNGRHDDVSRAIRTVATDFAERLRTNNFRVGTGPNSFVLTRDEWLNRARATWNAMVADVKMRLIDPNSALRIHRGLDAAEHTRLWADYANQFDASTSQFRAGSYVADSTAYKVGGAFGASQISLTPDRSLDTPGQNGFLRLEKFNSPSDIDARLTILNNRLTTVANEFGSAIDDIHSGKTPKLNNATIKTRLTQAAKTLPALGGAAVGIGVAASQIKQAADLFEQGLTIEGIRVLTKLATSEVGAVAGAIFGGGVPGSIAGGIIGDYLGDLAIDSIAKDLGPALGENVYGLIGEKVNFGGGITYRHISEPERPPSPDDVLSLRGLTENVSNYYGWIYREDLDTKADGFIIALERIEARPGQPAGPTRYIIHVNENGTVKQVTILNPDGSRTETTRNTASNELKSVSVTKNGDAVVRTAVATPTGEAASDFETTVQRASNAPLITGNQIGAIFGTTIGSALGGSNVFARIGLSSALGTALSFLGGVFDPIVKGTKLAVFDPIKQAFTNAATIPATFVNNLITAGSNAAASFFTAELAEALGIKKDNFGKALFTFAGTTTINTVLKAAASNVTAGKAIFEGFGGKLFSSGGGALTPSGLAPSFGAFIGSFVASRVVDIKNLGGSIGSSIGSAIGATIGKAIAGIQVVVNAVSTALSIATTVATTALNFVLPAIGAFIGYVFGATIGNWLGKVFGIGVDHGGATYHTVLEPGGSQANSVRIFNDDDSFGRPTRELSQAVADILTDILPKTGAKASKKITVAFHISNTKGHGRQSYVSVTGAGLYRNHNGQALLGYAVHHALKALDVSEAKAMSAAAINQLNSTDTTQILRRVGAAIAMDQIIEDIFVEFGEFKITPINAPNFNVNHANDDAVIAWAKGEVVTLLKGNATLEFWHEVDGVTRFGRIAWLDALTAGSTATTPEALALQISVAREYHNQLDILEDAIGGRMTRRLVSFNGVTSDNAAETLEQEIVTTLKGATISGGAGPAAFYVKRALKRSTATTFDGLIADVRTAEDYSLYLRERPVIDALIAQNPESAFAAAWLITLLKAGELGLAEIGADDFHAGFADFLQGYVIANAHDLTGISLADFDLVVVPAQGEATVAFELVFSRDADGNPDTILNLPNAFVLTGLTQLVSPSATTDGADLFEGTASNDNVAASAGHDVLRGNDGNDTLHGGDGNDILEGGVGADTLGGGDGHDILRGGTGDDILTGGAGDDVYLYRKGDGSDTITDASGFDTLILGVGIAQSDITAARAGNNLVLTIAGGSVTLTDWYVVKNRIERVVLADGSVLGTEDLNGLTGDTGAVGLGGKGKTIVAALNAIPQATVDPATGNFTMSVEGFEFSAEVGDVVSIVSGTTPDAVEQQNLAGATVQRYRYIGAVWVLTETEIYNADGTIASVDVVVNPAAALILRGDTLAFRADVSLDRIVIELDGDDMLVGVLDEDHSGPIPNVTNLEHVRLTDQLGANPTVTKFVLADGTELSDVRTPATGPMELTALTTGSAINGTARDELIKGGGGVDVLTGRGGNDRLEGREGDDIYRFGVGDGQDTIVDQRTIPASTRTERRREWYNVQVCGGEDGCYTARRWRWVTDTIHTPAREVDAGSTDTLVLEGISAVSLVWQIVGNDVVIGILAADHSGAIPTLASLADRITIKHAVDQSPIDKVVVDSTTFDLKVTASSVELTNADGNLRTYTYQAVPAPTLHYTMVEKTSAGQVVASETAQLDGTVTRTEYHLEADDPRTQTIQDFAGGKLLTSVTDHDDGLRTHDTEAGSQTLTGQANDDTFRFDRGDGADTIDNSIAGGEDRIRFTDADHDQLVFKQVGDDLVVDIVGSDDSVTVSDWFKEGADTQVDTISAGNDYAIAQKDVAKLVELMAGFDSTPDGATRLTSTQRTQVEQYFAGPPSSAA